MNEGFTSTRCSIAINCSLASVHGDLNCLNAHAGFYLGAGAGEGGGGGGRWDQDMFPPQKGNVSPKPSNFL